jgi:hypothetical protein
VLGKTLASLLIISCEQIISLVAGKTLLANLLAKDLDRSSDNF